MTLAITALAREMNARGEDVIGFGAGEPDFDTPDNIKEAAIAAINNNDTHYTPVPGTEAIKDAIITKFQRENQVEYRRDQIVVSCGAKQSFYNLAQVLWEPGDEVLIPAPYWVSYPDMVGLSGATPVILETKPENGFKITPDQVRDAINSNTQALLINSPSNPTGSGYSQKELEALAEVALRKNLLVISDEIYEKIVFDGFHFTSFASLGEEAQKNSIIINGVSKGYAMTGWRIGYIAAPTEVAAQVTKFQGQLTSNPCSISQAASVEALQGSQDAAETMRQEFQKRRDLVMDKFAQMPGVKCFRPIGSFYIFPDFSELYGKSHDDFKVEGSISLAEYLLKQAKVAVVPGAPFGEDKCARISFASSEEVLTKGLDRIGEALGKLK